MTDDLFEELMRELEEAEEDDFDLDEYIEDATEAEDSKLLQVLNGLDDD
jgi:hypothetical protein